MINWFYQYLMIIIELIVMMMVIRILLKTYKMNEFKIIKNELMGSIARWLKFIQKKKEMRKVFLRFFSLFFRLRGKVFRSLAEHKNELACHKLCHFFLSEKDAD